MFSNKKYVLMAPLRGLSTPRDLKVKTSKKTEIFFGYGIDVFLTDLYHILHARSCNYFLWFSHTPRPPGPVKRPKNFNLLIDFFKFYFFGLLFRAAMVTRLVQGP